MLHDHAPRRRAVVALPAALGIAMTVATYAEVTASRRDAETMKRKMAVIVEHGEGTSKQTRRTTVTENEVNAYLAYELRDSLPAGVQDPSVAILGTGQVSGRAIVNLDVVRKASGSTGLLDPRSYLTGSLPVTATGILRTGNGVGRFELQSATVGGVAIPKRFLQEIVSYYSQDPDQPGGVSLDDEFALPSRIREIVVQRGHAIIVQ